jgi:hypothetical protein
LFVESAWTLLVLLSLTSLCFRELFSRPKFEPGIPLWGKEAFEDSTMLTSVAPVFGLTRDA